MAADEGRIAEIETELLRELTQLTQQRDVALVPVALTSAQTRELSDLLKRPDLSPEEDLRARLLLGWLYWLRSLGEPGQNTALAVDMLVPAFAAGLDIKLFPPTLLPAVAEASMPAAASVLSRASATRDLSEASAAVSLWRRIVGAAPAGHPLRAVQLSNLGAALHLRYQRTGSAADLDSALEAAREAQADVAEDDPARAMILTNLASLLQARSAANGSLADLDAAVLTAREASALAPGRDPSSLSTLAGALQARASMTGSVTDLEAAIAVARQALAQTGTDDPDRARRLTHLGNALQSFYQHTADLDALNEAVGIRRLAVAVTPVSHPDRARRLANLGNALQDRFARTGAAEEIDQAIDVVRAALETTPQDHPDRPAMLSNLGNALQARFARTGEPSDLDEAIETVRAALETTPQDHPDRPAMLSNLGNALQARFARTGEPSDLDEAIRIFESAADSTPGWHQDTAKRLSALGRALQLRYERSGERSDYNRALQAFTGSIQRGSLADRIWAARLGGELAASTDPGLAADLLDTALRLLPELVPSWLAPGDQRSLFEEFSGLAADAAALALANQRADRALELLELWRQIRYDQMLGLRSDLTDLGERHPNLADRVTRLRGLFDSPAPDGQEGADIRESAGERRRLGESWQSLLTEVRALPGFSRFAMPPSAQELAAEAAHGAIAVLNVSRYGSHALLLANSGIRVLPLPGLTPETVLRRVESFREALFTATDGELPDRRAAQESLTETLQWLWDAAVGPVLDALGYRDQPPGGTAWPRLWWSADGPLALLPLHAAGYHAPGERRTALDRVVSSYTPTIRALSAARRTAARPLQRDLRALAVAMPTTPGVPGALPSVLQEVQILQQYIRDVVILVEPPVPELAEQVPTREAVLRYLPDCPIAHFACHGFSDPDDPSQSTLLLHDHATAPLTVAVLSALRLDNVRLAYLSASQTAVSVSSALLGGAVNLATAFHLAGYPHVIGTLWNIDDHASVQIAADFYRWLANSTPDVNTAAAALHHAIRNARNSSLMTPSAWAAHIHSGP